MTARTKLGPDVILRMAKGIEATDGAETKAVRFLGVALELDKQKVEKAMSPDGESFSLVDATQHLLNDWVHEHGSDDKAVTKLQMILSKKGYSKMADILREDSAKKPAASKTGHAHEQQPPPSTTDKIITLVTTIVVAALAITYINYRDFS